MKHVLWLDAVNAPPKNNNIHYYWAKGVYCAIDILLKCEYPIKDYGHIEYIDIEYDAEDYVEQGGQYSEFLRFLEVTGRKYPIKIHASDVNQVTELRDIINKNGWFEIT